MEGAAGARQRVSGSVKVNQSGRSDSSPAKSILDELEEILSMVGQPAHNRARIQSVEAIYHVMNGGDPLAEPKQENKNRSADKPEKRKVSWARQSL